jgi:hypothetical protein
MSQQMDWTGYGGSAAEIYERHMVPAIFGPWADDLLALAPPKPGERCWMWPVARALWHGSWLNAWARRGQWWALT